MSSNEGEIYMTGPIATDTRRAAPALPESFPNTNAPATAKPAVDSLASAATAKSSEESSYFACLCTLFLAAITTIGGWISHYLSSWFGSSKAEDKPAPTKAPAVETHKAQTAVPNDASTGIAMPVKGERLTLDRIVANQILASFREFFRGYEERIERVFPCRSLAFLVLDTNREGADLQGFKFGKLCHGKLEVTEGLEQFQAILPLTSTHLADFKLDILLICEPSPNKFEYITISFALANSAVAGSSKPQMQPHQSDGGCSSEELLKELHEQCPAFATFGKKEDILSSTHHLLDATFSKQI